MLKLQKQKVLLNKSPQSERENQTDSRLQIVERLGDDDAEDGVRSTALLVHVGCCNRARFVPLRHQHLDVLKRVEDEERRRQHRSLLLSPERTDRQQQLCNAWIVLTASRFSHVTHFMQPGQTRQPVHQINIRQRRAQRTRVETCARH